MAFVLANAHDPLAKAVGIPLRVIAVVAFAAVLMLGMRGLRRPGSAPEPAPGPAAGGMFGGRYGIVVLVEFALIALGIFSIRRLDAPEEAIVAWIALIVGVHFVVLMAVWKERTIAVPGAVLTVLGAAGLVTAATSAVEWVPLISGVLSGVVLLAGSLYTVIRGNDPATA